MAAAATVSSPFVERRQRPRGAERERAIDLVHLARATDGDESLEAELLQMFDRQSAKLVERVRLVELGPRVRADIAHRLRGSALAIGAFAVAEAAALVEAALESEGESAPALAALDVAVAAARAAIAELAL
jgi:HPt (histidine-containing phosphotransfer) domain-containing protein